MPPNPVRLIELLLAGQQLPLWTWLASAGFDGLAGHDNHWCRARPHCDLSWLAVLPAGSLDKRVLSRGGMRHIPNDWDDSGRWQFWKRHL